MYYSHIFVALFFGCILAVIGSPSVNQRNDLIDEAEKANMQFLGIIGNKMFFMNDTVESNWLGARESCEAEGFDLANFKNPEEFNFVHGLVASGTQLWVAANVKGMETADSASNDTRKTFEWGDGSEVLAVLPFHHYPDHWLCLIFSRDDHLYSDLCLSASHGTLCQKIINNVFQ